jgi:hypothetical protein
MLRSPSLDDKTVATAAAAADDGSNFILVCVCEYKLC